jgi:hypothetical protein
MNWTIDGKEAFPFMKYYALGYFAVAVYLISHLIKGYKWESFLPGYKFERIMESAENFQKRTDISKDSKAALRLISIMQRTTIHNMTELDNWMNGYEEYSILRRRIARIKASYAGIDSEEERLKMMKEGLKF